MQLQLFSTQDLGFLIKCWMLIYKLCKQLKFIRTAYQIIIQWSNKKEYKEHTSHIKRRVLCHFNQFSRPHDPWQPCQNFGFSSTPKWQWQNFLFSADRVFLWDIWLRVRPSHYSCRCFRTFYAHYPCKCFIISYTEIHNLSKAWVGNLKLW